MSLFRKILLSLSEIGSLQEFILSHRFSRNMAYRFVAGETLEQALPVAQELNRKGMSVTFDHVGEKSSSVAQAEEAEKAYLTILEKIQEKKVQANVSLKLTQLGLDKSEELCLTNLRAILAKALSLKNFIRIDMEDSGHTDQTLALFEKVYERYKNVGVVLQAALYRTETDLEKLLALRARVRLVKGAYLEPPEIAFPKKKEVDRNFSRLMKKLLENGNYPSIATHDLRLIHEAKSFAKEHGINPSRFEFQLLYGIRENLQEQLVQEGYRVRIYVPFGKEWYPYFIRRLAERPANLLFFLSSLLKTHKCSHSGTCLGMSQGNIHVALKSIRLGTSPGMSPSRARSNDYGKTGMGKYGPRPERESHLQTAG